MSTSKTKKGRSAMWAHVPTSASWGSAETFRCRVQWRENKIVAEREAAVLREKVRQLILKDPRPRKELAAILGTSTQALSTATNSYAVAGRPSVKTLQRIRAILTGETP